MMNTFPPWTKPVKERLLSAVSGSTLTLHLRRPADRLMAPLVSLSLWRTVVRGFAGGLIATAVMTIYRLPIFQALPPTSEFWALYIGDESANRYLVQGLLLHALYGGVAGAVFAPLFECLHARTALSRERVGLLSGVGYGLVLSVFGTRVLFEYVLQEELDPDNTLVFHVGHLIYGLTLGTWLSSREDFGDVYEQ
jgi:hypothetical protein